MKIKAIQIVREYIQDLLDKSNNKNFEYDLSLEQSYFIRGNRAWIFTTYIPDDIYRIMVLYSAQDNDFFLDVYKNVDSKCIHADNLIKHVDSDIYKELYNELKD